MRAQPLGQLDGGQPDPAAGAMDQHPLPGLQPADFDEAGIGGAIGRAQRRGGGKADPVRHRGDRPERDGGIFGKSPGLVAAIDPVTRGKAAVGISLDYFTGEFEPGNERQFRLQLVFAPGHQQVGEIERCGTDADQHLAGRTGGGGLVCQGDAGQVRGEALNHQCAHS